MTKAKTKNKGSKTRKRGKRDASNRYVLTYLSDYQLIAYDFLTDRPAGGAGLFDEMGGGKTAPAALALCNIIKPGEYVLIVSWGVAKPWWKAEIDRTTQNDLPVNIIDTKNRVVRPGVNIIHWEFVRYLVDYLRAFKWKVIILDESRRIKNRKSIIGKLIHQIRGEHNFCLDGFAAPNHPVELWNQLKWIRPDVFKSYWDFVFKYCECKMGQFGWVIGDLRDENQLYEDLKPYILRRLKADVLDLPEKTRIPVYVELNKKERTAYNGLIEDKVTQWRKKLLWAWSDASARTMARHLISGGKGSVTKIKVARELIQELKNQGHQLVVFSAFSATIENLLKLEDGDEERLIAGEAKNNQRKVDAFQQGDIAVLGSTMQLGGASITLHRSCKAVFIDMSYCPSDNIQAEDRLHRRGQTRPVEIYYILARKTVDEGILEAVENKRFTIAKVFCEKIVEFFK